MAVNFFSRIKSAVKAAWQAFRQPKTTTPAQPTQPTQPQTAKQKRKRTKTERVSRLQEITLNKNRDAAQTFYAATVNLWNVPEGDTEAKRNELIVEKLGVADLKEAYDLVMSRFTELRNQLGDDSVSPPPALTALQTELATRISENERS